MNIGRMVRVWSGLTCLLCSCASEVEPEATAEQAQWISSARSLEIELRVDEGDWALIRGEGRTLDGYWSGCSDPSFEYTAVDARLRIGKESFGRVRLRKRGLYGSLSMHKPSLTIDLTRSRRGFGAKTLLLSNSREDRSLTHQCMAYAAFARAGVPAPRCGFARLAVNGRELGDYVIVEAIDDAFLKRAFGQSRGALYAARPGADFSPDRLAFFAAANEAASRSGDPLEALTEALDAPESDLLRRLEPLLDVPAFMRFWAVESLISHWDGYTGNRNNFFVYAAQGTGKLAFIPWGTNTAYTRDHELLPEEGRPQSVYAVSRLARRLYANDEARELYRATLRELVREREQWNEARLLAEVDRIEALAQDADPEALDEQRQFIRNRPSELESELESEAPEWPFADLEPTDCRDLASSRISARFETTWGSVTAYRPSPNNALDVEIDGASLPTTQVLASAGIAPRDRSGLPSVVVLAPQPQGPFIVLQLYLGAMPLEPGEVPLHGVETTGVVVRSTDPQHFDMVGWVTDGVITLEEFEMTEGAPVRGHLEARLVTLPGPLAAAISE